MNDYSPCSLDAEMFVLGSILIDDAFLPDVADTLGQEDFSTEPHRRIYRRMRALHDRGERIDVLTLGNELLAAQELESVGNVSYLHSLTSGIPTIPNIESYVRIVQEMSLRRRGIHEARTLADRLATRSENSTDALIEAEKLLASLSAARNRHGEWQTPTEVIERYPGGLQAFLCPPRGGDGIPTPWPGITESLSGLHEGDLFVIAGRPGMGKTIVGMQMCDHAAMLGHGAAVFSLEMSNEDLTKRLIASKARVDIQKMRAGYLNAEERKRVFGALNSLSPLLWLDDTGARTIPAMHAALRRLSSQGKRPKLLMIDHLQLTRGGTRKADDRRLELESICHSTKEIARDYGCTVLLLSQLNRLCEIENRRPQLSDLKDCGAIEQDADVVAFIHRPENYAKNHQRKELRGLAEFILAKQRNGPTGKRDLVFLGTQQRFETPAYDRLEETA